MAKKVKIFCSFCKTPYKIYEKKSISLINGFLSLICSLALMGALWQQADPRFIFFFLFFLFFAEVFIYMRWRLSLSCRHCGFDPCLYTHRREIAVEKVREHLKKRQEDPRYMLMPALNLPYRKKEKENIKAMLPSSPPPTL